MGKDGEVDEEHITPIDPHSIPQQTQRQDSTLEQLGELYRWAIRLGMYDAADWLFRNRPKSSGSSVGGDDGE